MKEIIKLYQIFKKCGDVIIDSRKTTEGAIFFGFRGEHVDGNYYAEDAIDRGAKAAVVDNSEVIPSNDKNRDKYFLVEDVLQTLQELANYHRSQLSIPVIGITGSNGKTTTKELIRCVLEKEYKVFATKGNLNNHIGLPLSILSITDYYELAVLEFGANHPGEHEKLCDIAQPSHGLITNIGKDHLEGYGGMDGVIQAHKEFTQYLEENKCLFFCNVDDPLINTLFTNLPNVQFGTYDENQNINCAGKIIERFPALKIEVMKSLHNEEPFTLPTQLYGIYNFTNVMAAVCIGEYFELSVESIKAGIKEYKPSNNRSQLIYQDNTTIILDAYNANPSSMQKALEDFAGVDASCKIAILGDMFELGEYSDPEHEKIIDLLKELNFQAVLVGPIFGQFRDKLDGQFFQDANEAREWFQNANLEDCWILIKGSRGMALEKILD